MKRVVLLFVSIVLQLNYSCKGQIVVQNSLPCDTINYLNGFGYTSPQLRSITGMEVTPAKAIWLSFARIGIAYFDGNLWTIFNSQNTNNQIPCDTIHSIFLDNSGTLWIANNLSVTRKDQNGFKNYWLSSPMDIGTNPIKDISAVGSKVYLATNSGVVMLDTISSSWQTFNSSNSVLSNDTVNSFFNENNSKLWTCTNSGVTRFNNVGPDYAINNVPGNVVKYFALTPFDTLLGSGNNSLYRMHNNDCLNLDSIYFNKKSTTYMQWCDSNSLGNIVSGSNYESQHFLSSFIVNGNNDIYVIRKGERYGYFNITCLSHNHKYFTAGCSYFGASNSSKDYVEFYGDFILIGSSFTSSLVNHFLRKFEPSTEGHYREYDPSATATTSGTNGFDFSIPQSYVGPNQCDLNANLINARILNRGDLHSDPISGQPYYQVPINSGKITSSASAIWFGGYDQTGNLYTAAQTYRQSNSSDFIPGPLDINGQADSLASLYFDHIWMTRRSDIDEFRYQYALGNVQSGVYTIPAYILNWPAFYNNLNIQQNLAPFVDVNNDQLYNPYDGDYPDVKGDQMAWFIFNDDCNKTETGSNPIGIEIHGSAYGYYCNDAQDALSKLLSLTTFYHYDIYNRSQTNYDSCRFGMWSEFDLGNAADDFVGSNINNNSFFVYNGDSLDEGILGYGLCSPIQNVQILSGPEAPLNDGIDNNHNGVIDEANEQLGLSKFLKYPGSSLSMGFPSVKEDYYNYLAGRWLDSLLITYGGDGKGGGVGATSIPCSFMFPDTSDSNFGTSWTMVSANIQPSDMRGVGSVGPFNLPSGSKRSFDVAFITGPHDLNQNHILVKQLGDLFRSGQIEEYQSHATILGNTQIYNSGTSYSYFIPGLNTGMQVIWSVSNGLILSGQGTDSISVLWGVLGAGVVSAEVIDPLSPCRKAGKLNVEIGVTSLTEEGSDLTVRIYPNPTKSILQIESRDNRIFTLKVWDLEGRLIDENKYDGIYDTSFLKQGLYVLELIGENNKPLARKLFIKQ